MAVYVDDYNGRYGRMIMCHMMADTDAELDAMADKIGVQRKWKQKPVGKRPAHYDICKEKKQIALASGAVEITCFEMVKRFPSR